MAAAPRIGLPALALLDWLCEKGPNRRLFAGGPYGVHLFEISEPHADGKRRLKRVWPASGPLSDDPDAQALLDRLGGRDTIDYHALSQLKYVRGFSPLGHIGTDQARARKEYEAFTANFDRDYFHFQQTACVATAEGHEFWRTRGRALAEEARKKRADARAAVERTVLIGRPVAVRPRLPADLAGRIPQGTALPLPSRRVMIPYATATVVRQTGSRVYLRDIRPLETAGLGPRPVEGAFPNEYVSPDAIMVDGCTDGLARKLAAIALEFQADADAIGARIVEAMLPGLIDLDSRLKQKDAERADAVAESLREAGLRPAEPAGGKDEDAPPGP